MAMQTSMLSIKTVRCLSLALLLARSACAVKKVDSGVDEEAGTNQDFKRWLTSNELVSFPPPTPDDAIEGAGVVPVCGCTSSDFDRIPDISGLRAFSDKYCAESNDLNADGISNYVWAFGQFLVHDLMTSINQLSPVDGLPGRPVPSSSFSFELTPPGGGKAATMVIRRLEAVEGPDGCRQPLSSTTPLLDASAVYSPNADFLRGTLREPGDSCRLIVGPGDMLPLTAEAGTRGHLFITGDFRASEHMGLITLHTLFVREHNRICGIMDKHMSGGSSKWGPVYAAMSGDERFELARQVVVAKLQQITVKEWLPALGITQAAVRATAPKLTGPAMSLEFHAVAARVGDDLVSDTVGSLRLLDLFGGERYLGVTPDGTYDAAVANEKFDAAIEAFATSRAAAADGKVSDLLRNTVFGKFGHDIVTANLLRGRELHVQPYRKLAPCFGLTPDPEIMRDTPDSWLAMVRERRGAGERIGPLAAAIIKEQFQRTLFGEGGHWWGDAPEQLHGFVWQVRRATLAKLIVDNTKLDMQRTANAFQA